MTTRRPRPAPLGDKERWVARARARRCSTATIDLRGALGQGRAGASWPTASSSPPSPPRADPRDALCGAGGARRAGRGRPRRHVLAAPRRAAARAARRPRRRRAARQRRHAPAQARRRATTTRSCSPPPGCERLGRGDAGDAARRARPGRRARARWRSRPAPASEARGRARDRRRRPRRARWPPSARSSRALERRLPHAGRRPRAVDAPTALALRAFVGAPDGCAWVRDELDGVGPRARSARAVARAAAARRARDEVLGAVTGVYLVGAGPGRPRPADRARARAASRAPTSSSTTS